MSLALFITVFKVTRNANDQFLTDDGNIEDASVNSGNSKKHLSRMLTA